MFQTKVVEKIKSHFMLSNLFLENRAFYEIMWTNHSVRINNSTFERVEEFKYLGTTLNIKILLRKKLKAD